MTTYYLLKFWSQKFIYKINIKVAINILKVFPLSVSFMATSMITARQAELRFVDTCITIPSDFGINNLLKLTH